MMPGLNVDGTGAVCHTLWLAMPAGYEVAPDTAEVRALVAAHTWSTHVMVLYSAAGLDNGYPAYRTAGYPPGGQRFGDSQAKAQTRTSSSGAIEYICPWTCYQILIRRAIQTSPTSPPSTLLGYGRRRHNSSSTHPPLVDHILCQLRMV